MLTRNSLKSKGTPSLLNLAFFFPTTCCKHVKINISHFLFLVLPYPHTLLQNNLCPGLHSVTFGLYELEAPIQPTRSQPSFESLLGNRGVR
jgi:hypothetical protein